jgi:hypothetical protein
MKMSDNLQGTICDVYDEDKKHDVNVKITDMGITVDVEGYGDASSKDGYGSPILIEICEGELRVVLWNDINKHDPGHVISLEGAKEDKREPEDV